MSHSKFRAVPGGQETRDPSRGARRRSLSHLLAAICLATAASASWGADPGRLFERPASEQRQIEEELARERPHRMQAQEADPLAASGEALQRAEHVLRKVPSLVRENPLVFERYRALLARLETAVAELEALRSRAASATPPTAEALRAGADRVLDSIAALREEARKAFEAGLSRYAEEIRRPPALVVSGGVSLGSYQAGLLHLYVEYLRHSAQVLRQAGVEAPSRFEIITGASAGSINALLAAIAGCRPPPGRPEDSLFYQTWIPVGMNGEDGNGGLYDPAAVTPNSILSTTPLQEAVSRLERLWTPGEAGGWEGGCTFHYGAPATSLEARRLPLPLGFRPADNSDFALPIATEHFLLTFSNVGPGEAPRIRPYAFPSNFRHSPLRVSLGSSPSAELTFPETAALLRASSAFPVAFPPVSLRYAVPDANDQWRQLERPFVDGGVFDNDPLGIALRLDGWQGGDRPDSRILFVNSSIVASPHAPPAPLAGGGPALTGDLGGTYGPLLGQLASVTSQAQLLSALASDPTVLNRLDLPVRTTSVAGEFLWAFSSFLQKDFRVFDFYRGMADARRFILAQSPRSSPGLGLEPALPPVNSDIFACFVDHDEGRGLTEPCRKIDPNMRALLQATRDPFTGDAPQRLKDFQARLRKFGYQFKGDGPLRSTDMVPAIRRMGGKLTERLASKQDGALGKWLIATATENGLNAGVAHLAAPPYLALGLTTGGLEVAGSLPLVDLEHGELRLRPGLRLLPVQLQVLNATGQRVVRSDVLPALHLKGSFDVGWFGGLVRPTLSLGALAEVAGVWSAGSGELRFYSFRPALEVGLGVHVLERLELEARPLVYLTRPRMGEGYASWPPAPAWLGWSLAMSLRL